MVMNLKAAEPLVRSDNPNIVPYHPFFHCHGQPFHTFPLQHPTGPPRTLTLIWWNRGNQKRTSTSSQHCIYLPACSWAHLWYSLFPPITMDDMSISLRPTPPLCALDPIHSHPLKGKHPAILPLLLHH